MTGLWVVVPAYDEAARIGQTLRALRVQTDQEFTLLVVDNGSADDTARIARAAGAQVLVERQKGVGCAVDTGFRYAIAQGATRIVRTDADCLPRPGWVAAARTAFDAGAQMVCGRITARHDEHGPAGRAVFRLLVAVAAAFGRLRPAHHDDGYLAPYRMHAGNNMGITASLYEACGGMPRRPSPTDRIFLNRVRRCSAAIVHDKDMVVENSTRRISAYGVVATAKWYLDRGSGALTADPR